MKEEEIITHTNKWIQTVEIDLNFCPFAAKALLKKSIHYTVLQNPAPETIGIQQSLEALFNTFSHLDREEEVETAFMIFPDSFADFDEYLDLLEKASALLDMQGYEGTYQLASFHPDYCFEGSEPDDPANYTNRSPYPMLHILREQSVERALLAYKDAHLIPERNVDLARKKGLLYMQVLRSACFQ
jgi:hypothetical protein